MKDLATNNRDKPSQIFAQVVSQCDDNVQALLPREENRKRTIRYQRPTPPVSATYADARLPEEYTTTTNNPHNRLEEFTVSILTFIWQERIYYSACYIFESNTDGIQLFKTTSDCSVV
jgi:hypothetical protein